MPTVNLVPEESADPVVSKVFEDIKATKNIDFVPNIWRAFATHSQHLELCWIRSKASMKPGKVDLLTKEIIFLAVSVTNHATTASTRNLAGHSGTSVAFLKR